MKIVEASQIEELFGRLYNRVKLEHGPGWGRLEYTRRTRRATASGYEKAEIPRKVEFSVPKARKKAAVAAVVVACAMIAGLLGIISGAGLIALHIPAVIITVPVVLGFAAMIGDAEFLGTINQLLEQQVGAPKKRHQHLEGWVTLWIAAKDWPWSGRLRSLWALTGLVDYRTSHVDYLIHDVIRTAFEKLSELGEDDTESIDNQKLLDGYSELVRNNVGKLVNAYSRGRLASAIVLVTGGLWVMASLAVVYSQLR